jgi:hypothetical protein
VAYAKYDYAFGVEQGNTQARYGAGIEDISWRSDFDYFLSERVKLRWGAGLTHHTFLPGRLDPTSDSSNVRPYRVPTLRGLEAAAYLQATWKVSPRWLVEGGCGGRALPCWGRPRYILLSSSSPGIPSSFRRIALPRLMEHRSPA